MGNAIYPSSNNFCEDAIVFRLSLIMIGIICEWLSVSYPFERIKELIMSDMLMRCLRSAFIDSIFLMVINDHSQFMGGSIVEKIKLRAVLMRKSFNKLFVMAKAPTDAAALPSVAMIMSMSFIRFSCSHTPSP